MLSQNALNYIADTLEEYVDLLELCILVDSATSEDYDKSVKKVRKTIKKLREGKTDGILDPKMVAMYRDHLESEARSGSSLKNYG